MGTGPFAVPSFEALRSAGHEIALVVTKPMPPVKSRKGPPPSPVRSWAEQHNLPIFAPDTINDPDAIEKVGALNPWLLVVCDYGHILKPDALATATIGGINLHGSLLPLYRGAAPVQWSLLNGDAVTGVSVIHMTPRLDGGPIIASAQTPIHSDETAGELEQRLSEIGIAATLESVETLSKWDGEQTIGTVQDAAKVTKAPRLAKSDGDIDWGRSAAEIDFHVRGMQPWPVAFTHILVDPSKPPVRLAIKSVTATDLDASGHSAGEIIDGAPFERKGLLVASGDRIIEITRLQPAGKREMPATDFLRGHAPPPGAKLFSP
ncbi:Methionyl-tRNA formyltransferase [Rubripirellula lacrimiformis]|uniref:Methionyl-tRNA formyltransferase n=1 Tax=Rubripirellula lacrimiformis TaxID=1930273 RepID=A0A517NB82_9BACT|nr:Methionyl-tRNA formyltransferase [Rubripirellula lacrimiformis]